MFESLPSVETWTTWLFVATNFPAGCIALAFATPLHDWLMEKCPVEVNIQVERLTEVWSAIAGVEIPPRVFCGFLAACKLLGSLAFLGYFGPELDRLAIYCWEIYFCGASFTLLATQESAAPTLLFHTALFLRWYYC
eukprot:gnl/TRDRNA2_/TRDRNA2_199769_c0_seq1.p1 gnl/TRDRNA2_/TRDRNA2_199769_c0~~gnl/TRDRNA2_/TRDRNA2_199769_c0_seq1.p1  ORF type:complete len:137 (+),score=6.11 gnl/TRDRNA2_/TRDRNA2_199769_c0_seq1:92-502(+)